MRSQFFKFLPTFLFFTGAYAALSACPSVISTTYDYIVVGSGAGGGPLAARLAEKGYSVLVVDAGHDVHTVNTTIPFYFVRATEDPALELAYNINEYPPNFKYQKKDVWYPRARGLGGSTIMNAMINIIGDTRNDFDGLSKMFKDPSLSEDRMQEVFKRMERALYNTSNSDHGYNGWLKTSLNPMLTDPNFFDAQANSLFQSVVQSGPPVEDLNSLAEDFATGINIPSFSIDENHNRSSVRERLLSVQKANPGKLTFQLDTLATKVLLCKGKDGLPTAYGVQIAPNAALPVAGNFKGKQTLRTTNVLAKREVIVSAGVYQSPQLLMLSGIGDKTQLSKFGIETFVNLPGVGKNLQDHDEIATIWRMKQNLTFFDDCVLKYTREEDPCLKYWADTSKLHVYSFGPAFAVITRKSRPEYTEPDILTFIVAAHFPGFVKGFPQVLADTHNSITAITLKAHGDSQGTVTLTGNHPQDPLVIQKNHFQNKNGVRDVQDLREAIKANRAIMASAPIAEHVDVEIFPGPQANTDALVEDHIYKNIFGHHACCTNPMGVDGDSKAVLDGKLQVRGVSNLRVVDASSWPIVPGYFVMTEHYMLSERAADFIIAKATGTVVV